MKIQLSDKEILIEGVTVEEVDQIQDLVEKQEGFIFQLQKKGPSIVLVKLGDRATACNEAINVLFSSEDEDISIMSNLGHTPFEMDGIQYESVEGFWQSLKYEELEREKISKLHGKAAKKAGKKKEYANYINYFDQEIGVGSKEHWYLMEKACECKFRQNMEAQKCLLDTGIRPLYHKPRKDSETIPGPIMAGIWMNIRSKLRNEKGLRTNHLDILR